MPAIIIENMGRLKVHISQHTASILENLQEQYIDWMHACGGKGKCTTCRANIISGMEHLSPKNEKELRMDPRLLPHERLVCQAKASGDITLAVPEPCKLPHISYSH